jgi:hypothetical protein
MLSMLAIVIIISNCIAIALLLQDLCQPEISDKN